MKNTTTNTRTTEIRNRVREALGIEIIIGESNTSFGTSLYITGSGGKIRISDHSVTNTDRIMNEIHYQIDSIPYSCLIDDIEYVLFPERFKIEINEVYQVSNSADIFRDIDHYNSQRKNEIISIENITTSTGKERIKVTFKVILVKKNYKRVRI